jgi:Flp pilus assembly protein CpaB
MKTAHWLFLLAGLGLGSLIGHIQGAFSGRPPETVRVLVARNAISQGHYLDDDPAISFRFKSLPKDAVRPKACTEWEQLQNKWLTRTMGTGEVITENDLADEDPLLHSIPNGYRALKILTSDISILTIRPGCHVDLVCTLPPVGTSTERVSKIMVQNLRVLALARVGKEDDPYSTVVTLAAKPADVEMIHWLTSREPAALVVRSPGDSQQVETRGYGSRPWAAGSDGAVTLPVQRFPGTQPATTFHPA